MEITSGYKYVDPLAVFFMSLLHFQIFLLENCQSQSAIIKIRLPRSCGSNKVYYDECTWDMYTDLRYGCKKVTECACLPGYKETNGGCFSNKYVFLPQSILNHLFKPF